jgi:plastocyanin
MKRKIVWDSRRLLLAISVIAGLVIIGVIITQFGPSSAGGKDKDSSTNSSLSDKEAVPTPSATDPGNQQTKPTAATTITITADGFSPASISVARGTTLTWHNADTGNHAVASTGDDSSLHSPQLAPKASFHYSFQKTGTFTYNDPLNPSHTGTVTIIEHEHEEGEDEH